MANETLVPYGDALKLVADSLVDKKTIHVGGFWDFIKDIWSKSYERPELFNVWHVGYIADKLEKALQDKKNFCAVLPRYFLKSTILGYASVVWLFLRSANSRFDSSSMYLSFSAAMSQYHVSEINKAIRRNEQLQEWMKDEAPNSEYAFHYRIGNSSADILHGGVFSFKRGSHINRALICDDILLDPENPNNPSSQLTKIEAHFFTETMYIPTTGVPTIVLGTPMIPDDLLTKLRDDDRFEYVFLPALDPVPGRRVLCPEIITEEALLREKARQPSAFASQRMLAPLLSATAYLNEADIKSVENVALKSLDPYSLQQLDSDYTVGGFDIGKKRHPSHLVIYTSKKHKLTQVCQYWLDGWDYTRQTKFLNDVAKNFNIDRGYVDNTRGELEDRGLASVWRPMTFTAKSKRSMAQVFEKYVMEQAIEMIVDERQRSQITCVDQDLNAAETPLGHGDSMWSNALACLAFYEYDKKGTTIIGNMQELLEEPIQQTGTPFGTLQHQGTCPSCKETAGWVEERKLCLICRYRG